MSSPIRKVRTPPRRACIAAATLVTFLSSTLTPFLAFAQQSEAHAPRAVPVTPDVPPSALDSTPVRVEKSANPVLDVKNPVDLESARRALQRAYAGAVEEGAAEDPRAADAEKESEAKKQKAVERKVTPEVQAQALPARDSATVTGQAISLPKGGGTIQGMGESFSAQLSTGVATYEVPFSLPRARGDAQPSLGLSYSSGAGFGNAGVGWAIGVPFVARQTDRGIPKYADPAGFDPDQDRFVFNGGQELVPVCVVTGSLSCAGALAPPMGNRTEFMPVWSAGWTYFRPRVETGAFMRFFWSPDHREWRVQWQNGVTMQFGAYCGSTDTNALERNPARDSEIYRWLLARSYDTYGTTDPAVGCPVAHNSVHYRYLHDGGGAYLSDIFDTPPASGATTASLDTYAHHTRIRYESRRDVSHSYKSGWRIDQNLRVAGVDVTSKPFGSSTQPRELLRRYHLEYEGDSHVSLLGSVTVEGRCAPTGGTQIVEGSDGRLPGSTGCPTLPPMTFAYSHVQGRSSSASTTSSTLSGYEPFDERVRDLTGSPEYSLDEEQTGLQDVNGDALPDVLVTAPGFFNGAHGLFLNGAGGIADKFGASTMKVVTAGSASLNDIVLRNANLVALDFDGDGIANLVHMPTSSAYSVYSPKRVGTAWRWEGRATTASSLNPNIDLGRDAAHTKVLDVNFDGLVDVVRSTGTRLETYFALGRLPGGYGRFGQGKRTASDKAELNASPVSTCLPWSGTAVSLSSPDIQLADMNGDGIVDIVRLRQGDLRYWPGRGNGFWGTGERDDCPADTFGQGRDLSMSNSPYYSDIQGNSLRLEDVNGDGLSDLVQVRFRDVDIWLNVNGTGWTQRHILRNTPASPAYADRVRLMDVNGSGTPDIVWGDAGRYRYIDLQGGERPWLLTGVRNGLGKSTTLEYSTSVAEMLAAERAGKPWPKGVPIVAHVVKRVTVTDNLSIPGRAPSQDVTEYSYTEPVYDGGDREFIGFRQARERRVGDANSPAETTETNFLLGECVDEWPNDSIDPCAETESWRDHGRDALKGLPYFVERFRDDGYYLSSVISAYRLSRPYYGMDGRAVGYAWHRIHQPLEYDTTSVAPGGGTWTTWVVENDALLKTNATVATRSPAYAFTYSLFVNDLFGVRTLQQHQGCTTSPGCAGVQDYSRQSKHGAKYETTGDKWHVWHVLDQYFEMTPGQHSPAIPYKAYTITQDTHGRDVALNLWFDGVVDPVRTVSDAAFHPARTTPGWTQVNGKGYDAFGNQIAYVNVNGGCRTITYDTTYAQLPITETLFVNGCGSTALATNVNTYDRGLAVPLQVTDANGQVSRFEFDGFGRLTATYRPGNTAVPSTKLEYVLPSASGPAYSVVHSMTQDGDDPSIAAYLESWTYVDGLGRNVATISEAEDGKFIVSGLADYDNKGAVRREYLEYFANTSGFSQLNTSGPFRAQTYDAWGRPRLKYDLDGTLVEDNRYHAFSVETWDAGDFEPEHYGTYFLEQVDGYGQVAFTREYFKPPGGAMDARVTTYQYLPTGEPEVIKTSRLSTGETISRYMVYDTQGRLVMNVDPNTTPSYSLAATPNLTTAHAATYAGVAAWRYSYDFVGNLVSVSDSRGCGANFYYDGLGRRTMEDYFPCEPHHAPYSQPVIPGATMTNGVPSTTAGPASGAEVAYEYDSLAAVPKPGWSSGSSAGQIVRVRDQGKQSLLAYDVRGRVTAAAVQIARPGAFADDVLASRYAPRWFVKEASYDAADRPKVESTGAQVPELLAADGKSEVKTTYNTRGDIQSLASSYDYGTSGGGTALVGSITREADGFVTGVTYGDALATTTTKWPDDRRRVLQTMTERTTPASWPEPGLPTFQIELEETAVTYDDMSNPKTIVDNRLAGEWPSGAKPASKVIEYDDFNRVKRVEYVYSGVEANDDAWVPPFEDENTSSSIDSRRARPIAQVVFDNRVKFQAFSYDFAGNTTATADDAGGFYDRSLGTITNGTATAGPYQLKRATGAGSRGGTLTAAYDAAGNLSRLTVDRNGFCTTPAVCSQVYRYEWDELNRLQRARRWDFGDVDADAPPTVTDGTEVVDLRFRYDAEDNRIIKAAHDPATGDDAYTLYVFDSLDVRRTSFNAGGSGDYAVTLQSEVPYLSASGMRLARVVYEPGAPVSTPADQHVFFELGDHLGSTSTVLDKATGELIEKATYQAYGGTESDYRPARWAAFREDYRFTGKEEDVEAGLTYFGKRYYSSQLTRWLSPDPLEIHGVGKADRNLYAYVSGRVLRLVDPLGLCGEDGSGGCSGGGGAEGASGTLAGGSGAQPTEPPKPPKPTPASREEGFGGDVVGHFAEEFVNAHSRVARWFNQLNSASEQSDAGQLPDNHPSAAAGSLKAKPRSSKKGTSQETQSVTGPGEPEPTAQPGVLTDGRGRVALPTMKRSPYGWKIETNVPKDGVPAHWSRADIEDAIVDYRTSITTRKAEMKAIDALGGGDPKKRAGHALRITLEEQFLKSLEKARERPSR